MDLLLLGVSHHTAPVDLRERIDDLEAIHDFTFSFGRALDEETRKQRQLELLQLLH